MSTPVCIANAIADALGPDVDPQAVDRRRLPVAEALLGEEPVHEGDLLTLREVDTHGREESFHLTGVVAGGLCALWAQATHEALCDGAQSLDLEGLRSLVSELQPVAKAIGRTLG